MLWLGMMAKPYVLMIVNIMPGFAFKQKWMIFALLGRWLCDAEAPVTVGNILQLLRCATIFCIGHLNILPTQSWRKCIKISTLPQTIKIAQLAYILERHWLYDFQRLGR